MLATISARSFGVSATRHRDSARMPRREWHPLRGTCDRTDGRRAARAAAADGRYAAPVADRLMTDCRRWPLAPTWRGSNVPRLPARAARPPDEVARVEAAAGRWGQTAMGPALPRREAALQQGFHGRHVPAPEPGRQARWSARGSAADRVSVVSGSACTPGRTGSTGSFFFSGRKGKTAFHQVTTTGRPNLNKVAPRPDLLEV